MYGYGYRYNSGLVIGAGGGAPFANTKSLSFDGVDDYVRTTGNVLMNGGTELTISLWLNTANKAANQAIVSTFFGKQYVEMYLISGGLYCWIGNGSSTSNYNVVNSANLAINNNTWYNFTMVFDGSQPTNDTRLKVYKDGALLTWSTVRTIPTTLANNLTLDFYISTRNGTVPVNGNIDEVALFNRAVTPTEIVTLSTAPTVNLTDLNPIAWYRMGDGDTYPTITDNGSGGNDGTMTNMDAGDIVSDVPL